MTKIASCVVAGGNGQVGRMFAECLAKSGVRVTCVDVVDGPDTIAFEKGDITAPCNRVMSAVRRADVVLLAVPEQVALAAIKPLVAIMPRGSLLVDTLSVKSRIAEAVHLYAGHLEAMSLNPMFAPALGMNGRPIAVVCFRDGPLARELKRLIELWGARLVPLEAAKHDKLTAVTQAATHTAILAFGLTLQEWGVNTAELRAIAPPPHLTLLALLARIVSGTPEVYRDVQSGNVEAAAVRSALRRGIDRMEDAITDEQAFAVLIEELRAFLGDDREDLADVCARLFAHLL